MPEKHEPQHHDGGRLKSDDQMRERYAAARKEAEEKPTSGLSSVGRARKAAALKYARTLLRELGSAPALRTGQDLSAEDVTALVEDYVADSNIPASLKAKFKVACLAVAERAVAGNRLEADELARHQAFDLAEGLLKSAWSGPPEVEVPDVSRMPRVT